MNSFIELYPNDHSGSEDASRLSLTSTTCLIIATSRSGCIPSRIHLSVKESTLSEVEKGCQASNPH